MDISFIATEDGRSSQVTLNDNLQLPLSPFKTKDNVYAEEIIIDKNDPHSWRMAFCHELGHVLSLKRIESQEWFDEYDIENLRDEIIAWRLAKSFCKPKYWKEEQAVSAIKKWAEFTGIKVNWEKFKLIPLNKGIDLTTEND